MNQTAKKQKEKKIGIVESHFLDSGAFTLWTKADAYRKKNRCSKWDYFYTQEFWDYIDSYVAFIKKYKIAIDLYANVDVIPNPKLTWRNQKYIEAKYGLRPVPVVHYTTDIKWLEKYMNAGYPLIGLGGLVGSSMKEGFKEWLDDCFDMVCNTPDRKPKVKIHGFGLTSYKMLLRYPWWSIDSAAWDKVASYGGIMVPHYRYRNGKWRFVFDEAPYVMSVSVEGTGSKLNKESLDKSKTNKSMRKNKPDKKHFFQRTPEEKKIIQKWLNFIGVPLGSVDSEGNKKEEGVITYHVHRRIANLLFYDMFVKHLPKWPWSFRAKRETLI